MNAIAICGDLEVEIGEMLFLEVAGERATEDGMDGVRVSWTYSDKIRNEKLRGNVSGVFNPYPDSWGRGEWTAQTLEDARQMACDFAEGVS